MSLPLTLTNLCPLCKSRGHGLLCPDCTVVHYCCIDHTTANHRQHKNICKNIKEAQAKFDAEEKILLTKPNNLFEQKRGHFWLNFETREYRDARMDLVDALLNVNSREAVERALSHKLDMLHLCRYEDGGVSYGIPALFLRLGMEQECYDYLKWVSVFHTYIFL